MYRDFTHQAQAMSNMRYSRAVAPDRSHDRTLRKFVGQALIGLGARLAGQPLIGIERGAA